MKSYSLCGLNGPLGLQPCLDGTYNGSERELPIDRNLVFVRLKRCSSTCIKDEIGIDGPRIADEFR